MGRLFAGTQWDRPPRCEACGELEGECRCPPSPPAMEEARSPAEQRATLKVERRPRGKVATVIRGLDSAGGALEELAGRLKAACGSGGTVKDGCIEVQGDHLGRVETELKRLGYGVRRS